MIFLYFFNIFKRKIILICAIIVKGLSLIPNIFFFNFWFVLVLRFISGISQVLFTIYFPIWVEQYGLKKEKTIMIAIYQLGCPLGIVFGFGICFLVGKRVYFLFILLVGNSIYYYWYSNYYYWNYLYFY